MICSSKKSDLEFVQDVLCVLGMPIYEIREEVRESNLTHEVSTIYILTLNRKYLNESFFILSKHKERYLSKKSSLVQMYGLSIRLKLPMNLNLYIV